MKKAGGIQDVVRLEQIPNVGKAMASDLERLGFTSKEGLAEADPRELYDRLCRLDGVRHDPCVLDVFMAVVDFARGGAPRHWADFTSERKRRWPDL